MQILRTWLAGAIVTAMAVWVAPVLPVLADEGQEEREDQGVLGDLIPTPELRLSGPNALDNIVVEAGAGLQGFSEDLGDRLEGGASWTARVIIGARSLLGVEMAYTGGYYSVEGVDNLDIDFSLDPVDTTAMVTSTSFNAMGRMSFLDEKNPVKPFIAGGAGVYRLDSDVAAFNDTVSWEFPVAAGVQVFPYEHFSIAGRAEWKFLTGYDSDFPDGDQWGTMLTAGANF